MTHKQDTTTAGNTSKPHVHRDFIVQWANGCIIEQYIVDTWYEDSKPTWLEDRIYRVKPQPKPDIVIYGNMHEYVPNRRIDYLVYNLCGDFNEDKVRGDNLKVVYSGETGKLLSVELIK